jgi:hypothetical protein
MNSSYKLNVFVSIFGFSTVVDCLRELLRLVPGSRLAYKFACFWLVLVINRVLRVVCGMVGYTPLNTGPIETESCFGFAVPVFGTDTVLGS